MLKFSEELRALKWFSNGLNCFGNWTLASRFELDTAQQAVKLDSTVQTSVEYGDSCVEILRCQRIFWGTPTKRSQWAVAKKFNFLKHYESCWKSSLFNYFPDVVDI